MQTKTYLYLYTYFKQIIRSCENLTEKVQGDTCTDYKPRLDYLITKDDQLMFRCFDCKQNYQKDLKKIN